MHNEFFLFINNVLKCPCFLEHNNLVLISRKFFHVTDTSAHPAVVTTINA